MTSRPVFNKRGRRRGVILLLVLSLLSIFSLLMVAFMLSMNHMRRAAEAGARAEIQTFESEGRDDVHEAISILLRGAENTVLMNHSLLENLYGNTTVVDGGNTVDVLQGVFQLQDAGNAARFEWTDGSPNTTPDAKIFAYTLYVNPTFDPPNTSYDTNDFEEALSKRGYLGDLSLLDLAGNVLTVTEIANGSSNGSVNFTSAQNLARTRYLKAKSTRLLMVAPADTPVPDNLCGGSARTTPYKPTDDIFIIANDFGDIPSELAGFTLFELLDGCTYVINFRPYSGTGIGYNPDENQGSPLQTLTDNENIPYLLRPNPLAPNPFNGTNPPEQDYLDDLKAGVQTTATSKTMVRMNPDYTAPDLNALFLAWYEISNKTDGSAGIEAGDVTDAIPSFHRPSLISYWQDHNPSGSAISQELLRKIVLRPLPTDHPDFDGGNPMLSLGALQDLAGGLGSPLENVIADILGGAMKRKNDNSDPNDTDPLDDAAHQPSNYPYLTRYYDVDNDGDAINEGIWLDVGLPVQQDKDTKKYYKPLVSYTVRDLDGRINVNTHGNTDQVDNALNTVSPFASLPGLDQIALFDAGGRSGGNMLRGSGSGPADLDWLEAVTFQYKDQGGTKKEVSYPGEDQLRDLFGNNGNYSGNPPVIATGRYGEDTNNNNESPKPGTWRDMNIANPDLTPLNWPVQLRYYPVEDESIQSSLLKYDPADPASPSAFRGMAPDLWGWQTISYDMLGQRFFWPPFYDSSQTAWGAVSLYNPYDTDPYGDEAAGDLPFTAEEFEALLRFDDGDISRLPKRLLKLLVTEPSDSFTDDPSTTPPGLEKLAALRTFSQRLTARSSDVPTPASYLGRGAASIYSQVLRCVNRASNPEAQAKELLAQLPPEILEGRRIDLHRILRSDEVIAPAALSSPNADYLAGLVKRSEFAHKIFMLLVVLSHDHLYGYTPTTPSQADPQVVAYDPNTDGGISQWGGISKLEDDTGIGTNRDKQRQWTIARLAQWAVNLVDYIDPDDAMTPMVYDIDPFANGEYVKLSVNPGTVNEISLNAAFLSTVTAESDAVVNPLKGNQDFTPSGGGAAKKINLAWGMERPGILITETLGLHNRNTEDTATGDLVADGDDDFDQVNPPEPSLFVELYNASNPFRPDMIDHATGSTTMETDLGAMNIDATTGLVGTDPVWRMVVGRSNGSQNSGTPAGGVTGFNRGYPGSPQPFSFTFQTRQVWNDPTAAAPVPEGVCAHVLGASFSNANDEIEIDRLVWFTQTAPRDANVSFCYDSAKSVDANQAKLKPNEYLVLAPRMSTDLAVGATNAGQKIDLNDPRLQSRFAPWLLADDADEDTKKGYQSLSGVAKLPKRIVVTAAANNDIPLNVSGPVNDVGYYTPPGAPADTPFDLAAGTPIKDDGIYGDGMVEAYKPIFLQRLADPKRAYDPITNPYLTVDSSVVDLTVYNGARKNTTDIEPGLVGLSTLQLASRQTGVDLTNTTTNRSIFGRSLAVSPAGAAKNAVLTTAEQGQTPPDFDHYFQHGKTVTLGYVNNEDGATYPLPNKSSLASGHPFDDLNVLDENGNVVRNLLPTQAEQEIYVGAPCTYDTSSKIFTMKPFIIPPWNDAPLANTLDLTQVPASAPGRFGIEFMSGPPAGGLYGNNTSSLGYGTYHAHLLNFFRDDSVPPQATQITHDSLQLCRFLEYVGLPSKFKGTLRSIGTPADLFYYSKYREPGKLNLNTINESEWNALAGGRQMPGGMTYDDFHAIRLWGNGAANGFNDTKPVPMMFPFRNPASGALTTSGTDPANPITDFVRNFNQGSLFRSQLADANASLFSKMPNAPNDEAFTSYHMMESLNRLSDVTTNRSNVFAVWMTVAYFEVTRYDFSNTTDLGNLNSYLNSRVGYNVSYSQAQAEALYPDGCLLGKEFASDGNGKWRRHRMFYLIDRTIPVGFRRGQTLNTDNVIILQRQLP